MVGKIKIIDLYNDGINEIHKLGHVRFKETNESTSSIKIYYWDYKTNGDLLEERTLGLITPILNKWKNKVNYSTIVYNSRLFSLKHSDYSYNYFLNVIIHELLHSIGLTHIESENEVYNCWNVMNHTNSDYIHFGAFDIASYRKLWGIIMKRFRYLFTLFLLSLCLVSCSSKDPGDMILYASTDIGKNTRNEIDDMSTNVIYANIISTEVNFDSVTFYLNNIEYIKGEEINISKLEVSYNQNVTAKYFIDGDYWERERLYENLIKDEIKVYFYLEYKNESFKIVDHKNAINLDTFGACMYDDKYYNESR